MRYVKRRKSMRYVKIMFLLSCSFYFMSCSSVGVKKIGEVNMISNRNIDSGANYKVLRNYMGMSDEEIERTESKSIHDAVDQTVKNTPGGEFLKNAKLYEVKKGDAFYFAVEGDVWGLEENANYRGFRVGNKVQWKSLLSTNTGVITDLKDSKECTIKIDGSGKIEIVEYDELLKIE
jgi:hypothetical protein